MRLEQNNRRFRRKGRAVITLIRNSEVQLSGGDVPSNRRKEKLVYTNLFYHVSLSFSSFICPPLLLLSLSRARARDNDYAKSYSYPAY